MNKILADNDNCYKEQNEEPKSESEGQLTNPTREVTLEPGPEPQEAFRQEGSGGNVF